MISSSFFFGSFFVMHRCKSRYLKETACAELTQGIIVLRKEQKKFIKNFAKAFLNQASVSCTQWEDKDAT